MQTIGGQLDYHKLAQLHRPTDTRSLAAEVLRLNREGLTPADIAQALRLPLAFAIETVSRGALP